MHGTFAALGTRRIAVVTLAALLLPASAFAQGGPPTSIFAFGGVGDITPDDVFTYWKGPTWRLGGGVEHRFAGHFVLGGEFEILQRPESPGDQTSLLPSVIAGIELGTRRIRPFVTGGYTLAGSDAVFTIGGGVNVWLHNRIGARIELRDHRFIFDETVDSYGLRLGVVVR
jgi:hypothetical protein